MHDLIRFVGVIAFVWVVGYLVSSIYEAWKEYHEDVCARGNWALSLWWRWFSGSPAARKRWKETVAEVGILALVLGLPSLWLTGAFFAWQAGRLEAYWEWSKSCADLFVKGMDVVREYRG